MLIASQLYCERDDRILFKDLEFRLESGHILQIQGSNGSGKTTLLRILCGLNTDFSGEISWQGKSLQSARTDYYGSMFYMGHTPGIKKILTPMENLRWYCATQGISADQEIVEALARCGLRGYEDLPCFMMSAGQQRRVSLARLHLTRASLWILDEPFTALDRKGVAELESFLASHVAQGGAVILTTHHPLHLDCELSYINLDTGLTGTVEEGA